MVHDTSLLVIALSNFWQCDKGRGPSGFRGRLPNACGKAETNPPLISSRVYSFPKKRKNISGIKKASRVAKRQFAGSFFWLIHIFPRGTQLHLCADFAFIQKSYQHYQQHMHQKASNWGFFCWYFCGVIHKTHFYSLFWHKSQSCLQAQRPKRSQNES